MSTGTILTTLNRNERNYLIEIQLDFQDRNGREMTRTELIQEIERMRARNRAR